MWVNNETGVIQPIGEIAARCRAGGVLFHTDVVQAFGKVSDSLDSSAVDLVTISGHKIGGPKGVGALIVRGPLRPSTHHSRRRPAARDSGRVPRTSPASSGWRGPRRSPSAEQAEEPRRLAGLRDELARRGSAPRSPTSSSPARRRHAHRTCSTCMIPGADGEALLMHLDLAGVAASGGSACTTGAIEPSHVLTAMGVPRELALGAIRFSLGRETDSDDIRPGRRGSFPPSWTAASARASGGGR